ncbi:MAG: endopeptidase La [Deltaproteobacteria bacterium]|nr:endopeptidase La [Deltaproteobacteria bacterium]
MRLFKKDENDVTPGFTEIDEMHQAIQTAGMPPDVLKSVSKEIDRIAKMGPGSAEYTIGINYVDFLTSLPWDRSSEDRLDLEAAKSILDSEHYGLEDLKLRILEHLAVRILHATRRPRMLVVDDEKMTRMNLEHVLEKEGYEVLTARNGAEALDLLVQNRFDVILTDLKMDKVDGMTLLAQAKQDHPDTEVIIITGYATVPTAVEAMKKGSYQFLAKPLKLDDIRRTVKKALAPNRDKLKAAGPVLCFVGPPGTGKTSLGMSIARSLQRKFVRISLAGMKDEAQLRGHRRSYVGALPGRIIQELRRCETNNPVFMLDELDKIGQDFKGDPADALLEILDPQQNPHFMDHYLDVPFDLSMIMFIATANHLDNIPPPLLDRLEILWLSSYTEDEKVRIAFNHLIPRELKAAGLRDDPVRFDEGAVRKIIRDYTREPGLRNLQRKLAAMCRRIALNRLDGNLHQSTDVIAEGDVENYLGPAQFFFEVAQAKDRVGVATALAWTDAGGEIVFIEATKMRGSGNLILTGSLGSVMKESAQAALSYIRSNSRRYGIADDFFEQHDLHIHVPAGATPKDGTSAGLPIAMALISLITNRCCRRETATTGELTLTGRILPVGGIKEKLLAAHRAGVRTVVLPSKNSVSLSDVPQEVRQALDVLTIDELDAAIDSVLHKERQAAEKSGKN